MALLPACRVWVSQTVITAFQQWETQTREEDQKEIPEKLNYQLTSSKTQAESFRGKKCFGFITDQNVFWVDNVETQI